jgi:hypothetical protein
LSRKNNLTTLSIFPADAGSPAAKNTISHTVAHTFSASAFVVSSSKNLAILHFNHSASHTKYGNPLAPQRFATSVISSNSFLDIVCHDRRSAFTFCHIATASVNTGNVLFAVTSETSTNSIPKRKSGLSLPYKSIASAYDRRLKSTVICLCGTSLGIRS